MNDTLIRLETTDGIVVATIASEIDLGNASVLERYLREAASAGRGIVASLDECPYIDSSGLRALARVSASLGAFAVVVPPSGRVRRVFDIMGESMRIPLYKTLAEALAGMQRAVPA